jgi:hypothetical protein
MNPSEKKPDMRPRELKDGSGWYVLVQWKDRPSEQVGRFSSEAEAQDWVEHSSASWFDKRYGEITP